MITFKKIRYKNFLSSGSYLTELELDQSELTLIVGKNGAGKSTLLDAISFVLFNKPFRKINKTQLVNSVTKKNCLVEIDFQIAGKEYLVKRGIKPNLFEIYEDGKLIDQSALSKDYQDFLENDILYCNHKAFCQIVVLGSAVYIPFLELPAQQRREVVENIASLEIFSTMNATLKREISENNLKIQELNANKSVLLEKIKLNNENNEKQRLLHETYIRDFEAKIDDAKFTLSGYEADLIDLAPLKADYKRNNELVTELEDRHSTYLGDIKHWNIVLKQNKDTIAFYESHEECSQCQQHINEDFKKTILNNLHENIRLGEKHKQDVTDRCKELTDQISALKEQNLEIRAKIEADLILQSKVKSIKSEIEGYRASIEKMRVQSAQVINKNVDIYEEELQRVNLEIDVAERLKVTQNTLLKLLKDDGMKAILLKRYLNKFNELINFYLYQMDFMCEFHLDSEFNETIKSRYRHDFSYASFSEGEKLRINLAILFTWREIAKQRNAVATNVLIFDEILDSSLDFDGIEALFKLIKHLTKGSNTIIISHNSDSIGLADNVIEFKKIKGFSHKK